MDTDIRKYIRNNFHDCNRNDVEETINESVNAKDEVVLPGLGVLFEIVWNNADDILKKSIVDIIYNDTKKN